MKLAMRLEVLKILVKSLKNANEQHLSASVLHNVLYQLVALRFHSNYFGSAEKGRLGLRRTIIAVDVQSGRRLH